MAVEDTMLLLCTFVVSSAKSPTSKLGGFLVSRLIQLSQAYCRAYKLIVNHSHSCGPFICMPTGRPSGISCIG